jgi:hypothetical protein
MTRNHRKKSQSASRSAKTMATRIRDVTRRLAPRLVLPVADPRARLPLELRRRIATAAHATLDQVTAALSRLPENKGRGAGRKSNSAKGRSKVLVESTAVAAWLRDIAKQPGADARIGNALAEIARGVLRGDVEARRLPFFAAALSQKQAGELAASERSPKRSQASILTAAEAPLEVRRLLKSYDPSALRWAVREERYEIVVAILLRGGTEARAWLATVIGEDDARSLVAEFRGTGCAELDRQRLREQLGLTTDDIPTRPYLGFKMGGEHA